MSHTTIETSIAIRMDTTFVIQNKTNFLVTPCVIEIYYKSTTYKEYALHIPYKTIHYNHKSVPSNDK